MATEKEVEDFLAHTGILGMKWGKQKTPQNKFQKAFGLNRGKRVLTNRQKDARELVGLSAALVGVASVRVVATKGSAFLMRHPEIIQQTMNKVRGTKAIGIGYDVVKLTLKNGTWA